MITSAERRRPPVLVIALTLSLLVHLLGLLLYAGVAHKWLVAVEKISHKQPDEIVATSDRITLEKPESPSASVPSRPRPRPQPPRPPVPVAVPEPPQPKPEPTTVPTPVARREIARVVPRAEARPKPVATAPPAEERKVAYAPPQRQTVPTTRAPHTLNADQIAAYTQQFKQTIASARVDAQAARQNKRPPSTMKKYDFAMSGKLADLSSAQGEVTVLEAWLDRRNGLDMYYIHVRMVYSDGTSEIVDIPWPVGFPMGHDPLALRHAIFHHIPDPPNGWSLPHPFQLSRLLCLYYRDECKAVIDEEQRNGGASVAAPSVLSN